MGEGRNGGSFSIPVRMLMRILVAGYIVYLAWKIMSNAGAADNPVPLWCSILAASILALSAVAFVVYSVVQFARSIKGRESSAVPVLYEDELSESLKPVAQIYDRYLSATVELEKKRKATDGLMGLGNDPKKDACHEKFYEELSEVVGALAESEPSAQEAFEALTIMVKMPEKNRGNRLAFDMLLAGHALCPKLIPYLSGEDAAALAAWYREYYPRQERLPAQQATFEMLNEKGSRSRADSD